MLGLYQVEHAQSQDSSSGSCSGCLVLGLRGYLAKVPKSGSNEFFTSSSTAVRPRIRGRGIPTVPGTKKTACGVGVPLPVRAAAWGNFYYSNVYIKQGYSHGYSGIFRSRFGFTIQL